MNSAQAWMDEMSRQWREERSQTQMTLGQLVERLESFPADLQIDAMCEPHSYRGYYEDIAFETKSEKMPVLETLHIAKSCMGRTMQGYKGGDYMMGDSTPVWISMYGCCGDRLMGISDDGKLITSPNPSLE